ncbi:MAG TPA: hypothetical protein VGM77_03400 [Gemmatimonadales bacterium]|jgi:hypothetical protein
MKLAMVDVRPSPLGPARARIVGRFSYADRRPDEEIWFDVDEAHAGDLSRSGNPWLVALLPLAFTLQEPLEIALPVDPLLYEGSQALMQTWGVWYPAMGQPMPVTAEIKAADVSTRTDRTATLFSAGVDSFYTLLRHEVGGDAIHRERIDDLLTVWGFDIPLSAGDAFARLSDRIAEVAARTGKGAVTLVTNLRESGWTTANWGKIGQGPALAAVSLALEQRYSRVLFPASISYWSLASWGTHPFTDPLLSTATTSFQNDGSLARRRTKIEALASAPLAMEHLHACWWGQDDTNCGACEKCLRTLTALEMIGARDRAVTFPRAAWSLEALAGLRLRQDIDRANSVRLRADGVHYNRPDIAAAVDRSIRNYDRRVWLNRIARAVGLRRETAATRTP